MRLTLGLISVLVTGSAWAQPVPQVQWGQCTGADRGEVMRLLDIELRGDRAGEGQPGSCGEVVVRCDSDIWTLSVGGISQRIGKDELRGASRERRLALSIAELCFVARTRVPGAPPSPVSAPSPEAVPLPEELGPGWLLETAPRGRALLKGGLTSWGAEVSLSRRWGTRWLGYARVAGEAGSTRASLGEVSLRSYSAALGVSRELLHGARASLSAGAGVRAGSAELMGKPKAATFEGEALEGFWWGVELHATARWKLTRSLSVGLMLEAGEVARPVRGVIDGANDIGMLGPYLGASLALGWSF